MDQATARQHRGICAWNRWHLAAILARAGDPDAERTFHEVLAEAEELGMRPLQAHCHLDLGKLYGRVGRLDEARTELSSAVTMLREMGMAFWLPEAERELAEADSSAAVRFILLADYQRARVRRNGRGFALSASPRGGVVKARRWR